jgi:hypothetical protein
MKPWYIALLALAASTAQAADGPFPKGLPRSPDFFPTAVWLQSPANAAKYKAIGINVYVALWQGPTEAQLDALEKVGMPVICEQSPRSLRFKDRPIIVGWMHGDEPDNAQSLGRGKGYGPPVTPAKIVDEYEAMRRADPDRPVMLNLGQGVAWDGWYGRGVRTNHPEDYAEYAKGADIVSFDIYPACHEKEEIAGKLWYVPRGVDRLRGWAKGKDVWCCIETTGIDNPRRKVTPQGVHTEVWMALIHGAKGLIYFAHQFQPKFIEAGLLADEDISREVAAINKQVHELAPVLNAPEEPGLATVSSSEPAVPIDILARRHGGATYVFAVAMRDGETTGTFTLPHARGRVRVEVLGEGRTIEAHGRSWTDRFPGYGVHLYKITP